MTKQSTGKKKRVVRKLKEHAPQKEAAAKPVLVEELKPKKKNWFQSSVEFVREMLW